MSCACERMGYRDRYLGAGGSNRQRFQSRGQRTAVPRWGRLWVSTPSRSRRTSGCGFWWRTWAGVCLRASSGRSWSPWAFLSRESRSCVPAAATKTPPRIVLPPSLHCIGGARAWGVQSAINHRTLRPASVGGVVRGSKRPLAMQALPALWTHAA